jgi:uncharacterized protein YhbP (UPF0306 family)
MDLKQLINEHLGTSKLLHVATVNNNRPWGATVWYVHDPKLNLYFHSRKERRHSMELYKNPFIAGTIIVPPYPQNRGEKIRGLQLEGIGQECEQNLLADVRMLYLAKFQNSPDIPIESLQGQNATTMFYMFRPLKIVVTDQTAFSGETRHELILGE